MHTERESAEGDDRDLSDVCLCTLVLSFRGVVDTDRDPLLPLLGTVAVCQVLGPFDSVLKPPHVLIRVGVKEQEQASSGEQQHLQFTVEQLRPNG